MAMLGAIFPVLVGISLVTDSTGAFKNENPEISWSKLDYVRLGRNIFGGRNRRSPQMPQMPPIPNLPEGIPIPEIPQNIPLPNMQIPQIPGRRRRSPQLPMPPRPKLPENVPIPSLPTNANLPSMGRKRRSLDNDK